MKEEAAKKRIEELHKITAYHAKKYYDDDKPEISDFEYDMLMMELKGIIKQVDGDRYKRVNPVNCS